MGKYGFKKSEHVSEVLIHPNDPNTIWVASQGPMWSSGGQRGVYKVMMVVNHGRCFKSNKWTGATELKMDPRNPDRFMRSCGNVIALLLLIWVVDQEPESIDLKMERIGRNYPQAFHHQIWER